MSAAETNADLILTGGRILVSDPGFRIAQALAIAGERVLAVGGDADIAALADERTERIALRGRTVIPGLVDAHAHMDNEGLKGLYHSLSGCRSIKDIQERVAGLAAQAAPGSWIVTMPLGTPPYYRDAPECLAEGRYPTRRELDEAAPDNPVYIRPILGYWRGLGGFPLVSVANSRALELACIGRETLPPWGGILIDRDRFSGEPNGVFYEWAPVSVVEQTLMRVAPCFTEEDRVPALRGSMAAYNACGTTSVVESHGVQPEVVSAHRALRDSGESTVRVHLMVSPSWGSSSPGEVATMLRDWYGWCSGRGLGDAMLRVGGLYTRVGGESADVKLRTAAMPYRNFSGYVPDCEVPREMVRELVVEAARQGMRVTTLYADCLDLFEQADRVRSIGELRWMMCHIRTLSPDEIRRIRGLGLGVSTQTNRWIADQGSALAARLGPERQDEIVPLRRLSEAGVPFALATDNTPISLFHPLWHCVARRNARTGAAVAPSQALTREEALRAATSGGAWMTFEEGEKGTLQPGRFADLAVLSDDYLSVPEDRIKEIHSVLTMVGGRVVHRDGAL